MSKNLILVLLNVQVLLLFRCLFDNRDSSEASPIASVKHFSHSYFLGWAMSAMGCASSKNFLWLPAGILYELDRNQFAILCIHTCVSRVHSLLYSGTVCTGEAHSQH